MNKIALIPTIAVGLLGVAFASTVIFPNNNIEFPLVPTQTGTIGHVLTGAVSLFNPDGSAKNTQKLNGVTASGYLQNKNCTDPIKPVWIGVDPDGVAICGARSPMLVGNFTEIHGTIQVMSGSSSWVAINTFYNLHAGDTIKTIGTSSGTIKFAADDSILRLDTDTTVTLSTGQNDSGQSVAQAILSDGRLWGRILTSTGVNLGGGGIVAGVRGTSVSVEKPIGVSTYTLAIIDSTKSPIAATLHNLNSPAISLPSLAKGQKISYGSTTVLNSSSLLQTTKATSLSGSTWIRENTKADIDYLNDNSGSKSIIQLEYTATVPSDTDTAVLDALCEGATKSYWKSLIGTKFDKCREGGVLAFADYRAKNNTELDANFHFQDGRSPIDVLGLSNHADATSDGIGIIQSNHYIEYSTSLLNSSIGGGSLAGKTIKITFSKKLSEGITTSGVPQYIFDGDKIRYYYIHNDKCSPLETVFGNKICKTVGSDTVLYKDYANEKEISLEMKNLNSLNQPLEPTLFIVGARKASSSYIGQINNIVQKIEIQ